MTGQVYQMKRCKRVPWLGDFRSNLSERKRLCLPQVSEFIRRIGEIAQNEVVE